MANEDRESEAALSELELNSKERVAAIKPMVDELQKIRTLLEVQVQLTKKIHDHLKERSLHSQGPKQ